MPRRHLVVTAGAELRLEFDTDADRCNLGALGVATGYGSFGFGIRLRPGGMVISKRIGSQAPIEKL